MKKIQNLNDLEAIKKERENAAKKELIVVCGGTGCHGHGCQNVIAAFKEQITAKKMADTVELKVTGCHGFCERGPLALVTGKGILYQQLKPADVSDILEKTIKGDEIIDSLVFEDPVTKAHIAKEADIPFYKHQNRVIFSENQKLAPDVIEDYIAIGGYGALAKAVEMSPNAIIDEIKKSGLRGRGGGGFPTGKKWEICHAAESARKFVICNADEGDPGAYMDRSILEGNPHKVIEGMAIGAKAIGAKQGYIYVRAEYPLALAHAQKAIEQAREMGLLGKSIMGSDFNFDITICRGGGAFVCGEESALIASIEGRIGEPKPRPPYPAEKGLWNKPTNINNVETWANVSLILANGADWYSNIGTENSKGTKIFSLVGKINNTGLVEVPMGITLREIVYDIGGGIPGNKKFKAIQTGGPSGGCLPEDKLDMPIDFDELTKVGSMMGSGGLIVMDEDTCMVDVARYFTHFLKEESCGKCVPCREGVVHMLTILERICSGDGQESDLDLLEEMAVTIKSASLCALGGTSPNPVLSTIKYFRHEYEAHIKEKKCPSGVCKPLINYTITNKQCVGCMACAKACPVDAIQKTVESATVNGKVNDKLKVHEVIADKCIKCGMCVESCKFNAVEVA